MLTASVHSGSLVYSSFDAQKWDPIQGHHNLQLTTGLRQLELFRAIRPPWSCSVERKTGVKFALGGALVLIGAVRHSATTWQTMDRCYSRRSGVKRRRKNPAAIEFNAASPLPCPAAELSHFLIERLRDLSFVFILYRRSVTLLEVFLPHSWATTLL